MQRALAAVLVLISGCGGGGKTAADAEILPPPVDAAPCLADPPQAAVERVHTTSGLVRGKQAGPIWKYLSVPYALQPSGGQRFFAAVDPPCSPIELDATVNGPLCPQPDGDGGTLGREECLQLSIWAPAASATPRPVMVWFHGGGNISGDAADPMYDGARLALAGDVIVVSVSFRLGQLGFLTTVGLQNEGLFAGAFGLSDQRQALLWLGQNIAAFGGDPNNLTIFGSGSGADDICALLAMNTGWPFQRAILQSASCRGLPDFNVAVSFGDQLTAAIGCSSFDNGCLRSSKTAAQIILGAPPDPSLFALPNALRYQPPVSSQLLFQQPYAVFDSGVAAPLPLLVGSNVDELAAAAPAIATEAAYEAALDERYGPFSSQVKDEYPIADYASPRDAFVRATTDQRFACPARELARSHSQFSSTDAFRYQFSAPTPVGAVYGAEVAYVFGNFDAWLVNGAPYTPSAADLALSARMQAEWTAFARSGAPAADWPAWDTTDPVRVYGDTVRVELAAGASHCDFWKTSGL